MEKVPSNITTKTMNMNIWEVGTSNQYLHEVLKLKQNFRKNKVVTYKTLFFVIGSFCTHHSICFKIGF